MSSPYGIATHALTVWQPHADLIAAGVKDVENRTRRLRGPFPLRIGIHAGLLMDEDALRALPDHVYTQTTGVHGALIAFVTLTGCHHYVNCAHLEAGEGRPSFCSPYAEPDRYHLTLADPVRLADPIPMRGRQGLWRLPELT